MDAAHAEFESLFAASKALDGKASEDPAAWGYKDKIMAEAWQAYYTGDPAVLDSIIDEAGFTDEIKAIEKNKT